MSQKKADIFTRVEALRQEIRRHDELYYSKARPEISDQQYDALMRELGELEKEHPELVTADSPTQRAGGEPIDEFHQVRHAVRMMSIDNTYNEAELREFDKRVRKALGDEGFSYTCEPKIDGVSLSLRYEDGVLKTAATRGNGTVGDDVTQNAKTIRHVPLRLSAEVKGLKTERKKGVALFVGEEMPAVLEVRGEAFMNRPDFVKLNQTMEEAGEEPYANPRNTTAGSLKQLDPKITATRKLDFVPHGAGEIVGAEFETYTEWYAFLKAIGFQTNPHFKAAGDIEAVLAYIHEFATLRQKLPYDTDGVVVKIDRFEQRRALGETSKAPRWCIAYKYQPEQAETTIKEVIFQVGKTGAISPVALFDPVPFISGTNVYRATLHNYDEIERKDIHLHDTVLVEKAGEVIPYVVGVVTAKRPAGAKKIGRPTKCPSCGATDLEQDGPRVMCVNPACPAQLAERLQFFAGRNQMDIEDLGEKLVEKLLAKGTVKSIPDLYRLTHEDLFEALRREETKDSNPTKAAQNVLEGIAASKDRGLHRLLAGLGILRIGNRTAQLVAQHFTSLKALRAASLADILNAPEMGSGILKEVDKLKERYPITEPLTVEQIFGSAIIPAGLQKKIDDTAAAKEHHKSANEMIANIRDHGVAAKSLYDFLHSKSGQKTLDELIELGLKTTEAPLVTRAGPLTGLSIVVTGTLENFSRSQIKNEIESHGGKSVDSVSKSTAFVLAGADPGSKLDKAKKLGVEVIDEKEFLKRIGKT